ncbi:hypothetical protein EVAR_39739_1 [Eumeta japonica]|uniref:Uncharacterized protein n=1 Tax=Eumeta variegata TaxID=151549 RepID=A0A4C1X4G2_EUMVA|nr:hypothetical protein EVAR_39739_1 [Eumeta japonica]
MKDVIPDVPGYAGSSSTEAVLQNRVGRECLGRRGRRLAPPTSSLTVLLFLSIIRLRHNRLDMFRFTVATWLHAVNAQISRTGSYSHTIPCCYHISSIPQDILAV